MAETAVNVVIDKLIPLLSDEVKLLRGVHVEIASIKEQLGLIKAYIKDADAKAERAETSSLVKEWVRQVREVAYRIEDVVNDYLFRVAKRRQKHGLVGAVTRIGQLLRTVVPRHAVALEIVQVRESLKRLHEAKDTFGFSPSATAEANEVSRYTARQKVPVGARFVDDDQLVGVHKTKQKLMGWLSNRETRRTVISVVGEGGLGKTTIVNNVYNKQKDERTFDCYAWLTVSHSLKDTKLLKTMMQSFYEHDGNRSGAKEINEIVVMDALTNKLREYLHGRRYMIVFDDVWDINFWEGVEFALPDENNSSRIIITTRDKGVAEFCRRFARIHIHELEPLPPKDALKLFHLKAFQFDDLQCCPEELLGLSQDFVKKCDGVPLAIVAIAGLLSTKKKVVSEWQRVHDSLHSKLASDPHLKGFFQVLSESFDDLPYHLKLCLLYFSLFPEGYSINCVRLINLWIAEGFVKKDVNEDQTSLMEVADEYLNELIRRSLVKVSKLYYYGRIRKCRIHDLMHNFILKKCEELNFCQVKKNEEFRFHSLTRRLSIHTNNNNDASLQSSTNYGRIRSCFVFNVHELPKPMVGSLLSSFKLLTGLDFEDAPLDHFPEAIGNLLHLKYLNLRNTKVKTIPKFIGNLQNLETLNLKQSLVSELPKEITKLVKLRFLIAYSCDYYARLENIDGVKLKEGIGQLRALQKLSSINATDGDDIINDLKNLKHMRRLTVVKLKRHQGKLLCCAIENMNHLCSLGITAAEEHEVLDLQWLNDPPRCLERLYIEGRIEKLPNWIPRLRNLVKLFISWSGLEEDPLPMLQNLPELMELVLFKSYEGDELHFKTGWFGKLETLVLRGMQSLRTLRIDMGALPSLVRMSLLLCPRLLEVPVGIQNLETLKYLYLEEMPDELLNGIKLKEGKDYNKIKKIPFVIHVKNNKTFYLHEL